MTEEETYIYSLGSRQLLNQYREAVECYHYCPHKCEHQEDYKFKLTPNELEREIIKRLLRSQ